MKTRTFVTTLFAAALIAAPVATFAGQGQGPGQRQGADRHAPQHRAQAERGQRDMGSDRLRMHDRAGVADQDRIRDQDRTHAPEGIQQDANRIYGYNLMSEEERNAYQERIRKADSSEEREQIEAQHRHEMRVRAAEKGVQIEEPVQNRTGRDEG